MNVCKSSEHPPKPIREEKNVWVGTVVSHIQCITSSLLILAHNGGGGFEDPVDGDSKLQQPLPGMGLHGPLHDRQARPKLFFILSGDWSNLSPGATF